jgi:flagellar hook-associated protein 1 FlgK
MASNVGLYTYGTQINLDAQTNVLNQVTQRMESISGVNLDEEAANLMRFQQAYQASAQLIQVSNTLFDTLIGVIR